MSGAVAGDPSGCSQLGAELRSRAAGLLELHGALVERAATRPRGSRPPALDPALVERDRAALDAVAVHLDAAGEALQRYAQDLAGCAEEVRRLEREAAAAGLELDGLRVVEPWGVADPDVAHARRAAIPELQRRSERLAARLARARGSLRRALADGGDTLERTATGVRRSLGA